MNHRKYFKCIETRSFVNFSPNIKDRKVSTVHEGKYYIAYGNDFDLSRDILHGWPRDLFADVSNVELLLIMKNRIKVRYMP
jgi:hypothetical protein